MRSMVTEAIDGNVDAELAPKLLDGDQAGLDVAGIEAGFDQQEIGAAFDQALGLLVVVRAKFGEGDACR